MSGLKWGYRTAFHARQKRVQNATLAPTSAPARRSWPFCSANSPPRGKLAASDARAGLGEADAESLIDSCCAGFDSHWFRADAAAASRAIQVIPAAQGFPVCSRASKNARPDLRSTAASCVQAHRRTNRSIRFPRRIRGRAVDLRRRTGGNGYLRNARGCKWNYLKISFCYNGLRRNFETFCVLFVQHPSEKGLSRPV